MGLALCQQSLDGGSWLIAQEVMLEPPPPLSTFTSQRVQQLGVLESFHSRLLDPRVADLFLYRVKEVEGYHLEAKRKLGKAQVRLKALNRLERPMTLCALLRTEKAQERERKASPTNIKNQAPPGAMGLESLFAASPVSLGWLSWLCPSSMRFALIVCWLIFVCLSLPQRIRVSQPSWTFAAPRLDSAFPDPVSLGLVRRLQPCWCYRSCRKQCENELLQPAVSRKP